MNKEVLLVEDDPMIARTLTMSLPYRGYAVSSVRTLNEGLQASADRRFDIVLIDLQLPDGSGYDLCQSLKERSPDLPVLIITARTDEKTAVHSLTLGADDHIRKPFGLDELTARMGRLLRDEPSSSAPLCFRELTIDMARRRVQIKGTEISLGRREFEILALLVRRQGEVVTRAEILDLFPDSLDTFDRTVDSHLSHLRKKMRAVVGERLRIHPVYGVGYRLEGEEGIS